MSDVSPKNTPKACTMFSLFPFVAFPSLIHTPTGNFLPVLSSSLSTFTRVLPLSEEAIEGPDLKSFSAQPGASCLGEETWASLTQANVHNRIQAWVGDREGLERSSVPTSACSSCVA